MVVLPWQREEIGLGPIRDRELELRPLCYLTERYFPRQSWLMASFLKAYTPSNIFPGMSQEPTYLQIPGDTYEVL